MQPLRSLPLYLLLLGIGVVAGAVHAQPQEPPVQAEATAGAAPTSRLQSLEAEQAAVAAEIVALAAGPKDPSSAERLERLGRLDHVLTQYLNELRRSDELALQAEKARETATEVSEASLGSPPYPLAVYDRLRTERERSQAELAQLEAAVDTARNALKAAGQELDAREKSRRQAKEAGAADLARFELESRIARAAVGLREAEVANALANRDLQRDRLAAAERSLAEVVSRLEVRPEERNQLRAEIDAEEASLRRRLERAELDLQEAKSRWTAAQGLAPVGTEAELAALRAQLSRRQKEVALLGEELDLLAKTREIHDRRFDIFGLPAPDRGQLLEWLAVARQSLQERDRDRSLDLAEISTLEQELAGLGEPVGPAQTARHHALAARVASQRAHLKRLEEVRQLERRLIAELEERSGAASWSDRLAGLRSQARDVWRYELFASGDSPITVGKLTSALGIVALGLLFARRLSRAAEQKLLPRFGYDPGASHAFAVLAFYALLVGIFLVALRLVNIPLTAFAILGGALAIGLGFGSQNIVNNFISGIILLAERPIKIGDLIQMEDTYGNVEHIGLRSTRVRTGENIHLILPNSMLLENRVVNWTHRDPRVRVKLNVGIVYGSPTREAEELLRKAITEHPRVLPTPEPIILFTNFGDNSLDFQAHFWVSVRHQMDRLKIESELRFRLDELYREAGIVIAFPQRDVHLDSTSPLEIKLVEAAPGPRENP